jgi:NTE family protein
VDVANAVGASLAIPIVFRLPRIARLTHHPARDLFTDGGIVSNLPAWPFDEDRELDPEACTIAVDIPDETRRRPLGHFTWVESPLRTGFFGLSELNLRAVKPSFHIPLPTDVGLLQFALPTSKMFQAISDATSVTTRYFEKEGERARQLRDACETLHRILFKALSEDQAAAANGAGRLRLALAIPDEGYTSSLRLNDFLPSSLRDVAP